MTQKYFIKYPSSYRFELVGTFSVEEVPDRATLVPTVHVDYHGTQDAVVLDQRAIIRDENNKLVYSPRMYADGMAPQVSKWLRQNPDWGKVST